VTVMSAQMPLPLLPSQAIPIGTAAGLVEGGVVFLHGVAVPQPPWDGWGSGYWPTPG
jgi:hypothetical protein